MGRRVDVDGASFVEGGGFALRQRRRRQHHVAVAVVLVFHPDLHPHSLERRDDGAGTDGGRGGHRRGRRGRSRLDAASAHQRRDEPDHEQYSDPREGPFHVTKNHGRIGAGREAAASARIARLRARRFGGRGTFVGGSGAITQFTRAGDRDVDPAVSIATGLTGARLAAPEGRIVAEHPVAGELQKIGVVAQKSARVDLGETDVEVVAFEFLQVVPANFSRLGGLANGNTFFFARLLEAFTDSLHGDGLGCWNRKGKKELREVVHNESRSTRISRGLEPFSGPTTPFSSMRSIMRAARL